MSGERKNNIPRNTKGKALPGWESGNVRENNNRT